MQVQGVLYNVPLVLNKAACCLLRFMLDTVAFMIVIVMIVRTIGVGFFRIFSHLFLSPPFPFFLDLPLVQISVPAVSFITRVHSYTFQGQ